jgi:putative endonuclease
VAIRGLTRWPLWRRWFGMRAERAAEKFLRRRGCKMLGRNVRLPMGELDLVVLDGEVIAFVEVRSTEGDVNRPMQSVDAVKQKRLSDLAVAWLQRNRLLGRAVRFDVIAVSWPAGQREPQIKHYPAAFPATGRFQMYS